MTAPAIGPARLLDSPLSPDNGSAPTSPSFPNSSSSSPPLLGNVSAIKGNQKNYELTKMLYWVQTLYYIVFKSHCSGYQHLFYYKGYRPSIAYQFLQWIRTDLSIIIMC